MRVWKSLDGEWRAELRDGRWRLFHRRALVLDGADLKARDAFLRQHGVDPDELVED